MTYELGENRYGKSRVRHRRESVADEAGEVDLSQLGASPADLLGVGPTASSSDPGGPLVVAPIGSTMCPAAQFHTIQSAVDAAPAGSMIKVCAGTYVEQVAIPDRLVPLDAAVEIEAKKAAGYFAPAGIPDPEELSGIRGRALDD